jgi:squalene-associated FAD-dependent desaturase
MSSARDQPRRTSLAVVGGGLAGLATAVAAAEQGLRVELFERRRQLGGRIGGFRDPLLGGLVDDCPHLSMGCCTNLADFCRRTGIAHCFQRYRTPHFFGPQGTRHDFASSGWLPPPLHLAPALMRLGYLSVGERWAIMGAMRRLARARPGGAPSGSHAEETIGQWLLRQGQSPRSIESFWSVILVGALSDTVDRISLSAARKVFVDGFLGARTACELEVPKVPLAEIVGRIAAWLAGRDVAVHLGTGVTRIDGDARGAATLIFPGGQRRHFDFVVVAVPWWRVRSLFSDEMLAAMPSLEAVEQIQPAAITAVHLWFDRPIMPLPHAVLVGRLGQWVFNHGGQNPSPERRHYLQVVISASRGLSGRPREDVVSEVRRGLEGIWPEAGAARLLHWRLVTRPAAVFSCRPGLDRFRPGQQTRVKNLMLAGDWTATGWPATMESAVRSGYLAVEGVLRALGKEERLLVPDLPRGRLARLLLGLASQTARRRGPRGEP